MATNAKQSDAVFQRELQEIARRRDVCGLNNSDTGRVGGAAAVADSLTGVALSGGGVRSGAFSLGILQALYSRGRLRFVDYLSTVSGGGYAGALFSTLVARSPEGLEWTPRPKDSDGRNRLDLESPDGMQQPERVQQLALHGRMMTNSLRFLSRHFWGWLLNTSFVVCGVLCGASLISLLMKSLWNVENQPTLAELGCYTDPRVAFFPALLAFLLWVMSHGVQFISKLVRVRVPPFTAYSYILLIITVILGLVALLATGDIGLDQLVSANKITVDQVDRLHQVQHWLVYGGGALVGSLFLPFLRPQRLLESGRSSRKLHERFIYQAAGVGLVAGIPLLCFFFLCKENVSGFLETRPRSDGLAHPYISTEEKFHEALKIHAENPESPLHHIALQLLGRVGTRPTISPDSNPNGPNNSASDVSPAVAQRVATAASSLEQHWDDAVRRKQSVDDMNLKTPLTKRYGDYLASLVGLSDSFDQRVTRRLAQREAKIRLTELLNDNCLSNARLFSETTVSEEPLSEANKRPAVVSPAWLKDDKDLPKVTRALEELRGAELMLNQHAEKWMTVLSRSSEAATVSARENDPGQMQSQITDLPETDVAALNRSAYAKALSGSQLLRTLNDADGVATKILEQLSNDSPHLRESHELEARRMIEDVRKELGYRLGEIRRANWALLSVAFPEFIKPSETVFATVVNAADQTYRWRMFFGSGVLFLILGLLTNLNNTCLHSLYRDQLEEIWLPRSNQKLADLNTCRRGGPLHLFNATLNRMGRREDPDAEQRSRFVMSNLFCGSKRVGYRETADYLLNGITVADAIAVSGAAVSASSVSGLLSRVILFMTNLRLGQWYQNPAQLTNGHYWPSPLRILFNLLWNPSERSHVFVTDGGHLENLGISALLERRCRVIVAADAGLDPQYHFEDLVALLHAAQSKYGIAVVSVSVVRGDGRLEEISEGLRLDALRPAHVRTAGSSASPTKPLPLSDVHFGIIRLHYPEQRQDGLARNRDGLLIYCKASLTGDEPLGLTELLGRQDDPFPHDATSDQFLPPDRFAAYNVLGYHIGCVVEDFISRGGLQPFGRIAPADWLKEQNDPTEFVKVRSQIARLLSENSPFNPESVELALSFCTAWLKQREHRPLDAKRLELLMNWARENGDADPVSSRRFCTGLERCFREHREIFREEVVLRQAVLDAVAYLGKGQFTKTLRDLATPTKLETV